MCARFVFNTAAECTKCCSHACPQAVHQLFKSLEGFPPLETTTVAVPPPASAAAPAAGAAGSGEAQQQGAGEPGGGPSPQQQAPRKQQQQQQQPSLQCVQVRVGKGGGRGGGGGGRGQKRKWGQEGGGSSGGGGWPGGDKEFVRFALYKENTDQHVSGSKGARGLPPAWGVGLGWWARPRQGPQLLLQRGCARLQHNPGC